MSILDTWEISADELTLLVDENPSLRGILFGYVAEHHLTKLLEVGDHVSESLKYDDHDRTRKGDRVVSYKGCRFVVESKSLQSNSIKSIGEGRWVGKAQVDASDRRTVILPDGSSLDTTLLLRGEFDVLAVNCFAFKEEWRWAFCKNTDLPSSKYAKYTEAQRRSLLASLVEVKWPPEPPFRDNIFTILDELVAERGDSSASSS